MLYRVELTAETGKQTRIHETGNYYEAIKHCRMAEANPQIAEIVCKIDRRNGEGMVEVSRYTK